MRLLSVLTAALAGLGGGAAALHSPAPQPAPAALSAAQPQVVALHAPVAATPLSGGPGSPWRELAQCESGGRWALDGRYDGGLQFLPATWRGYGGAEFAPAAWQATPSEQVVVAERVLAAQGWGAWPSCSRRLGFR